MLYFGKVFVGYSAFHWMWAWMEVTMVPLVYVSGCRWQRAVDKFGDNAISCFPEKVSENSYLRGVPKKGLI